VGDVHGLPCACDPVACLGKSLDKLCLVHVAVGALDGCDVATVDPNCSPVEGSDDFDVVHFGFPFLVDISSV